MLDYFHHVQMIIISRLANVRPANGNSWTDDAVDALFNLTAEVVCQVIS